MTTDNTSADETRRSKVDWSTPFDGWLVPILNRARRSGPIEFRALPSEVQLNIEAYVKQRELALLERLEGEQIPVAALTVKEREFEQIQAVPLSAIQKERQSLLQKPIDAQKIKELAKRINESEEQHGSN